MKSENQNKIEKRVISDITANEFLELLKQHFDEVTLRNKHINQDKEYFYNKLKKNDE